MINEPNDTIAAIATPPGLGGIAILRISGPDALKIVKALFSRPLETSHMLTYGHIVHRGERLDEVMAVCMRKPRSYTREDVVEFHCHGGDMAARRVLDAILSLGVRPAAPGEFTKRAFENGRIDLTQAEAAMMLIGAQGQAAARAAMMQMDGAVSRKIRAAQEKIIEMLSEIAACVDFPDEIEEAPTAKKVAAEARTLSAALQNACDARLGRVLEDGFSVAIAGRPNVGKSSLLNALLGEERAIVTALPGTTRDTVGGSLHLSGVRVNLTDTAGLREAEGPAERFGIDRAKAAIQSADLVLIVLDASAPLTEEDRILLSGTGPLPDATLLGGAEKKDRIIVFNKMDLVLDKIGLALTKTDLVPDKTDFIQNKTNLPVPLDIPYDIALSAKTLDGVDALLSLISARAAATQAGDALLTQARHVDAASRAAGLLASMAASLEEGVPVDFASIDAHEALSALMEITGESAEESVIDAVFRNFCVGK